MTRGRQLFLIDDDDDLRFTIALSLRDAGLEVEEFASADDALPALRASPPGAVFLDYRIDGMSAETFVEEARKTNGDVPVVLLTGSHDIADLAAKMKVFDSLGKPFDIDDLVGRANKALAANR